MSSRQTGQLALDTFSTHCKNNYVSLMHVKLIKYTDLVLILEFVGKAHVAALAVKKLVSPSNPTDAAAITVVLVLVLVVKKFALQTGILKIGLLLKIT